MRRLAGTRARRNIRAGVGTGDRHDTKDGYDTGDRREKCTEQQ